MTAAEQEPFDVGAFLTAAVPMVGTLGLEYVETTPQRAVLKFRDQPAYRNHVGGPHAGAMFTLAESASGAIVTAAFGHLMAEATPLPTTATIAAMHCPRPVRRLSFLASAMATTGAVKTDCKGERVRMKSQ